MTIELRSAPHRKIAVADILPNPHRDLENNPVSPARVEELIESYARTGFWDNIVVREHPTRDGKYELAYGHNRLSALNDKNIIVDTITIPVADLTDWEMFEAMVDENAMQGAMTPAIAFENIDTGCDLIEKALKKVGKKGTWEEFNEAIGRHDRSVVSRDTTLRAKNDGGFEQVRNGFFEGEGLGRGFLEGYLPGGKRMRSNTLSTVLNERYAETREAAKRAAAKIKEEEAKEKGRLAKEEEDAQERERLEKEAAQAKAEAAKLEAAAEKIGKGKIAKDILLKFETPGRMTDFAEAIRKLGIDPKHHKAAAKMVLDNDLMKAGIARGLDLWWDEHSGAAAERRKKAKAQQAYEQFKKASGGKDPVDYLLKIADDLKDITPRIKTVIENVHMFGSRERKVIREKIAPFARLLDDLLKRERETLSETKDITPATKMLSHRKG